MLPEPDPVEVRVLGCLIEKQRATPDVYPLTLNALRLACNQATNRDPVVEYDEATIRKALGSLGRRGWIRSASGHTSRVAKYRQLFEEAMKLPGDQVSVLAVLMLRGVQTPGEIKQRAERLHHFDSLAAVHETLDALVDRDLVARLPRRPGQKEERFEQRLGGEPEEREEPEAVSPERESGGDDRLTRSAGGDRLTRLELELADLRREVEDLRQAIGELRPPS